jgi:anti-sigma B factor antagonist
MSHDSPQPYQVDQVEGVTVVTVVGNQLAPDTKDALYAVAGGPAGAAQPRQVVLDLANVRILNSTAIGILINFQRKVRDAGGWQLIIGFVDLSRGDKPTSINELG